MLAHPRRTARPPHPHRAPAAPAPRAPAGGWLRSALRGVLALCVLGLCGTPFAHAQESDGLTIRLSGPGLAYQSVEYSLEARHGTVIARVTKRFIGRFGHFEKIDLLALEELPQLLGRWFPEEPTAAPLDLRSPHARAQIEVRWRRGVQRGHWLLSWPPSPRGAEYLARVREIQAQIEARVGAIAYRDALLLPTESGRLQVSSTPSAQVRLNGILLPEPTPLPDLILAAGRYELALIPLDGGPEQRHTIEVPAGRLTRLQLDLR